MTLDQEWKELQKAQDRWWPSDAFQVEGEHPYNPVTGEMITGFFQWFCVTAVHENGVEYMPYRPSLPRILPFDRMHRFPLKVNR
jgi:hypothetical protein